MRHQHLLKLTTYNTHDCTRARVSLRLTHVGSTTTYYTLIKTDLHTRTYIHTHTHAPETSLQPHPKGLPINDDDEL